MNQINRRSLVLLLFLSLLLLQFGRWHGQVNSEQSVESGGNSTFLLLYVPLLYVVLKFGNGLGYLKVFRPLLRPLLLFLVAIIAVGLFRGHFSTAIQNMGSILLTYSIIIGLSAVSFSLPIRRMIDVYIIFIAFIFLPVTIYIHNAYVGPLVLFPDRLESNNLRLGGLIYYAHTAMLLGIGALFSLYQFLISRSRQSRLYYSIIFIALNFFLLFTDCRSSWGGVGLAYATLIILSLPKPKRRFIIGLTAAAVIIYYAGAFSIKTSNQYQTSDDFMFRIAIWSFALDGIAERPLTGYGTENYFSSNKKAMDMDERLSDPHSATLSLALQSGLPVVILFFSLYFRIVRYYYRYGIKERKVLIAVTLYWLFVPLFWGTIYNGAAGFIQIMFPLTYFVSLLHPDLYHIILKTESFSNDSKVDITLEHYKNPSKYTVA